MSDPSPSALRPATRAIQLGRPAAHPDAPLNEPLTPATAFHADGLIGYAREGNPGWAALESAIGDLEGGTAVAVSAGIAAVDLIIDLLPIGATVVAQEVSYAGTLARLGHHADSGRIALRLTTAGKIAGRSRKADLVWVETPANPTLDVVDIARVAERRQEGALVVVDNTLATPMLQRPMQLGADIVVHSASKYIAGHSDALLGIVVAADAALGERLRMGRAGAGCTPGVLESFLALRGLRTMPLRVERASYNALELATRLQQHPDVLEALHPGLPSHPAHDIAMRQMSAGGALVSWRPAGGAKRAERITHATRVWIHATSLGGVESTLERRRRWPFEAAGVPKDLIRLSVGCEDLEDLWGDLADALRDTTA